MGVQGLWQLLNSTGKPVPLESLEGRVLAVDVSVWLHQLSKGMRDSSGNPLPNAHLHGLFTRICKLLYYRIKPVFVFDGGVPVLKKQTLAARRGKREDAEQASLQMQQKILTNLIRSQALQEAYRIESALIVPPAAKGSVKGNKDAIFELPPLPESSKMFLSQKSDTDDKFTERQELREIVEDQFADMQAIDVESDWFQSLPLELQHEIITDIRLSRKNYNLSKITDLPDDSKDFSSFQMAKLVKHNKLNTRLDSLRRDLNQRQTKSIATKYGAKFNDSDEVYSSRVFSEDYSHYILAKRNVTCRIHGNNVNKKSVLSTVEEVDDVSTVSKPVKGFADELVESDEDESEIREVTFQASRSGNRTGKSRENAGSSTSGLERADIKQRFCSSKQIVTKNPAKFKPVIEIDSGSDSEDDIGPYVDITDKTEGANGDDSEAEDQDLQQAIQESLRDQQSGHCSAMETSNELEHNGDMPNNSKAVIVIDDINTNMKHTSLACNDLSKSVLTSKRVFTIEKESIEKSNESKATRDIFKRKISCMSDKSGASDTEPKKVKVIDVSDDEEPVEDLPKADEHSSDKDSESDDDFIEVKINMDELKEDEMFPASIFQTIIAEEEPEIQNRRETDNINKSSITLVGSVSADVQNEILPTSAENSMKKIPLNMEKEASVSGTLQNYSGTTTAVTGVEITAGSSKCFAAETDKVESSVKPVKEVSGVEITAEIFEGFAKEKDKVVVNVKPVQERLKVAEAHAAQEPDTRQMAEMESFYSDHEDEMMKGVEQSAGDHGSDLSDKKVKKPSSSAATGATDLVRQYESLRENHVRALRDNMTQQNHQLRLDQGKQERMAVSITDQMNTEAQELLQLFGIPYIVSPTEAEAQCAYLEMVGLTHGTITDDSDIWLFGGKCVFKNFFNQKKYVECFKDVNITSQLGLSREALINLALLCGSDYTSGIRGVGPVLGLEILAEFSGPGVSGLQKFKEWWDKCQKQITVQKYESKLRAKLRELDIQEDFPSSVVVDAYLQPTVDESKEKFTWGLPDVELLRQFTSVKLRWDKAKTDENLLPVIKRLEEKQAQRSISSFFQPEVYIQPTRHTSKRVQNVVEKIKNTKQNVPSVDDIEDNTEVEVISKQAKKRRKNQGQSANGIDLNENVLSDNLENPGGEKRAKVERSVKGRRKINSKNTSSVNSKDQQLKTDVNDIKMTKKTRRKTPVAVNENVAEQESKEDDLIRTEYMESSEISKTADKYSSGSSVDSDSDSETESDFTEDSDTEVSVITSGLNIEEILSLKMGDSCDAPCTTNKNGTFSSRTKHDNKQERVFKNRFNVDEILRLTGKFEPGKDASKNETQVKRSEKEINSKNENEDNSKGKDRHEADGLIKSVECVKNRTVCEIKDEIDYSTEGGFIREDSDDNKSVSQNIMNTRSMQVTKEVISKLKSDVVENAHLEAENKPNPTVELNKQMCETVCEKQNTDVTKLNSKLKNESGSTKEEHRIKRATKKPSIYSENPIKPVVKGVPWADTGRKTKKGVSSKGKTKGPLMKKIPIGFVSQSSAKTKKSKSAIGFCKLSESDSD